MIVIKLQGGLGNQMFQYAAAQSLALIHDTRVCFDISSLEGQSKKNITHRTFSLNIFGLGKNICANPYRKMIELPVNPAKRFFTKIKRRLIRFSYYCESSLAFDPSFFNLGKNSCLEGYFQSENYFIRFEDFFRRTFIFHLSDDFKYHGIQKKIISENSISLHIRYGDYGTADAATHGLLNPSYYLKAVSFIKEKTGKPFIFIFSDHKVPDEFRKQLNCPNAVVPTEKNDGQITDMYLMSQCRHHIIANSTFSWWGAWLNNKPGKIVIAPARWFSDPVKQGQAGDIVPYSWTKI
ncbi:MAG: alpha-1,2-fucosyltransferase [Bacteroidetes bacterium]|nr:alpha-1,2-fucosyltransferase [Bacteroidota bacterium]